MRYSQLPTAASWRNAGCVAVCRQHRVLQRVGGVLGIAAGHQGEPVELTLVAVEQLLEGVPVAGDVGSQQLRIGAELSALPLEGPHSRTLKGAAGALRHIFGGLGMDGGQRWTKTRP